MLDDFKKKLTEKYWIRGNCWSFDWYIDCFFVDVMAYGDNPIKINYEQPVLGDEFLGFPTEEKILESFSSFFDSKDEINTLLGRQKDILKEADQLVRQIKTNKKFNFKQYEKVQKDLSLLMASVSVVFDPLISKEVDRISNQEEYSKQAIIDYIVSQSSKTKLTESNFKLKDIYLRFRKELKRPNFTVENLSEKLKKKLASHQEAYGWLNTGERGKQPWTVADFVEQMRKITNKESNNSVNLKGLSNKSTTLVKQMVQININDNLASDKQVELDFLFQHYLKATLKDDYIEPIIENLTYEEILLLIQQPRLIDTFEDRFNNLMRVVWPEKGKINCYFFKNETEYKEIQMLVSSQTNYKTDISGNVASSGYVEGTAKIIKTLGDLDDFKDGEIMVAVQTQPSYVMQMNKAKAIVTDIGGITSHAAIIARELKVPCIVGTGNATKLLKTGDIIIVDAVKGKVIKKG